MIKDSILPPICISTILSMLPVTTILLLLFLLKVKVQSSIDPHALSPVLSNNEFADLLEITF